jgi:hypothetical protein
VLAKSHCWPVALRQVDAARESKGTMDIGIEGLHKRYGTFSGAAWRPDLKDRLGEGSACTVGTVGFRSKTTLLTPPFTGLEARYRTYPVRRTRCEPPEPCANAALAWCSSITRCSRICRCSRNVAFGLRSRRRRERPKGAAG